MNTANTEDIDIVGSTEQVTPPSSSPPSRHRLRHVNVASATTVRTRTRTRTSRPSLSASSFRLSSTSTARRPTPPPSVTTTRNAHPRFRIAAPIPALAPCQHQQQQQQQQSSGVRPRIRIFKPHLHTTPITARPTIVATNTIITSSSSSSSAPAPNNSKNKNNDSLVESPPQEAHIRRRLTFNVGSANKRLRRCSNTTERKIKVHGNAQRTQPTKQKVSASSSKGPLESLLSTQCSLANDACMTFKNFIAATNISNIGLGRSLVVNVLSKVSSSLYITSSSFFDSSTINTMHSTLNHPNGTASNVCGRLAIKIPKTSLDIDVSSEQVVSQTQIQSQFHCQPSQYNTTPTSSNLVLFIPQPWYAMRPSDSEASSHLLVDWIILPFKAFIIDSHCLPTLPSTVTSNSELDKIQAINVNQTDTNNVHRIRSNLFSSTKVYHHFDDIPAHKLKVTICVSIVWKFENANIALLRDVSSQLALLKSTDHCTESIPSTGYHTFDSVSISCHDFPSDVVQGLVMANCDDYNNLFSNDIQTRLSSTDSKMILFTR